jgi:replicative DNA helicase
MSSNSNKNLRVPPQNIESEQALLGSIMLKPEGIMDAIDIISSDSFYAEKHRIVFQSMIALYSKSEPIDLLSITSKLDEKKKLEQIGGRSYLTELVNSVPSASNLKHYAEIIQKKSIMRNLLDVSNHIGELGYAEDKDLEELLDEAEKRVFSVTNASVGQKFVSIKHTLGDAWDRIDNLHNNKDATRGIKTGFKNLDNHLAGFQKSDLIILAARPSMGKTALALDIARQAATMYNTPVGIFSLEMSAQQLVDRMLAAESRVDAWKLRTGNLSQDVEFTKIRDSLDKLSKAPIYIDDKPGNTMLGMRSTARRLKSEHGLGLIIVDYLQLITPSKNFDSMVHQVTEISRSLKSLARELDVPVLALSQLSRAVEQRQGRPRLSDLRDSGSIEQDADVVMFIHRDDKYNEDSDKPNIAEIMIEKHRNGPTGKIDLYFDDKKTTFLDIDKNENEEANETSLEDF